MDVFISQLVTNFTYCTLTRSGSKVVVVVAVVVVVVFICNTYYLLIFFKCS